MSRRPTKAYRLYTGHSLEELTALIVEIQERRAELPGGRLFVMHPADIKRSTDLAMAIQWKLDERNPHG